MRFSYHNYDIVNFTSRQQLPVIIKGYKNKSGHFGKILQNPLHNCPQLKIFVFQFNCQWITIFDNFLKVKMMRIFSTEL